MTPRYLLKGLKENYQEYGVDWPANRYLVIAPVGRRRRQGPQTDADARRQRLALPI